MRVDAKVTFLEIAIFPTDRTYYFALMFLEGINSPLGGLLYAEFCDGDWIFDFFYLRRLYQKVKDWITT